MSGFMFGGSALTLDIGVVNATGAAVTEGMVLAIEMDSAPASDNDGFRAQIPAVVAGTPELLLTAHGAALVPSGMSIPNGENVIVRVVGPCKVRVDGNSQNIAIGDLLFTVNGGTDLVTGASQPDFVTASTNEASNVIDVNALMVLLKTKAVARATANADNVLIDAWMKGLPV